MVTVAKEGIEGLKPGQEEYLQKLYENAADGDASAMEKLGQIAAGRNDLSVARTLYRQLEVITANRSK